MTENYRRLSWRAKQQSGGVLIELSLILPVLAIMAVGVVNIGMSLGEKQMLVEATRYAARRAGGEAYPSCEPSTQVPPILSDISFPDPPMQPKPTTCVNVLAAGGTRGSVDPVVLGNYYACQMVKEAGMEPGKWVAVTTKLSVANQPEIVQVFLRPNPRARKNFFISALMGATFPQGESRFFVRRACGSE